MALLPNVRRYIKARLQICAHRGCHFFRHKIGLRHCTALSQPSRLQNHQPSLQSHRKPAWAGSSLAGSSKSGYAQFLVDICSIGTFLGGCKWKNNYELQIRIMKLKLVSNKFGISKETLLRALSPQFETSCKKYCQMAREVVLVHKPLLLG